ncbi:YgzB family protein [Pseudalkalibacillus berkeleyi]|uniref:YgzB family protein n=1 Tax=Pseudalkalibacillus berkeleyi TaxID=1069813 RepID=A0ABS9H304_9BACL|nr:YgzB family protein [Pseudalkalibacillus berkeleyi]MCF6139339.1 YgzB family protein [Pseudalkalibacillus berkeleyi]
MALKYTSKINKIRTFALSLVFIGIVIMYLGLYFKASFTVMTIFMLVGFLATLSSAAVYIWIGMLSTKAVQVECPNCHKVTKVLGRVDACMFCKQPLTMDPSLEGIEFDEKYNQKKQPKEEG